MVHKSDPQGPIDLPPPFAGRMRALLGAEAGAFLESLTAPPLAGLRVNTLKIAPADFRARSPFALEPLPWCSEGFLVKNAGEIRPARHPYHAAGLYYLQDPSAMAVTGLLDPRPGEWVLDLCGAPGGKATHIAARLQGEGGLVANEIRSSRAAALVENLERFGATRILVLSAAPEALAERWPASFDRVLVDAPCSGEGLFRKNPLARREWGPAVVEGCALRQTSILAAAAPLVRPGGRLVYSTCTFAPEENEAVVARFLRAQPEFELIDPPRLPGLDPGRPDWIEPALAAGLPLERCVRLWPHRAPGEGHFAAVLERRGEAPPARWPPARETLPPRERRWLGQFEDETLTGSLPEEGWLVAGQMLFRPPFEPAAWQPWRPARAGWQVGKVGGSHFAPAHALAMALPAGRVRPEKQLDLRPEAAEVAAYLRGEVLRRPGPPGWLLVTVDGFPLGWGKRVGEAVKNHYPRHLYRR